MKIKIKSHTIETDDIIHYREYNSEIIVHFRYHLSVSIYFENESKALEIKNKLDTLLNAKDL